MDAGTRIRAILKEDKMTMTDLAERMGVSRQALYKRCERDMTFSHFVEAMEAMGYKLYYTKDGKTLKKL